MQISKNDWLKIGETAGWIQKEAVQNPNLSLTPNALQDLKSKLAARGEAGRIALTMLNSKTYLPAINAIMDVLQGNMGLWKNLLDQAEKASMQQTITQTPR